MYYVTYLTLICKDKFDYSFLGNAFRSAYAHQLHDKNTISDQMIRPGSALGFHNNRPHLMQSSRSADSLLSPDVINEDQGITYLC